MYHKYPISVEMLSTSSSKRYIRRYTKKIILSWITLRNRSTKIDPAPAKPPTIIDPQMLIIMSADVPITTPPTNVELWKRTCTHTRQIESLNKFNLIPLFVNMNLPCSTLCLPSRFQKNSWKGESKRRRRSRSWLLMSNKY